MKTLPILPLFLFVFTPCHARAAANAPQQQIRFTTKFIEADQKVVKKAGILSGAQFQKKLRELGERKGTGILSAPTVVARNNQSAKIEVIREFPFSTSREGGQTVLDTIHVGVTLEIDAAIDGDHIHFVGKATMREVDEPAPDQSRFGTSIPRTAGEFPRKPSQPFVTTSFNTTETVFDVSLLDGHTLLMPCRQSEKIKGQLLLAVTAQRLDPSGKPVKAAGSAAARGKIADAGKILPFS